MQHEDSTNCEYCKNTGSLRRTSDGEDRWAFKSQCSECGFGEFIGCTEYNGRLFNESARLIPIEYLKDEPAQFDSSTEHLDSDFAFAFRVIERGGHDFALIVRVIPIPLDDLRYTTHVSGQYPARGSWKDIL